MEHKSAKRWACKLKSLLCFAAVLVLFLTSCNSDTQIQPQYGEPVVTQPQCTYKLDFSLSSEPEDAMGNGMWYIPTLGRK